MYNYKKVVNVNAKLNHIEMDVIQILAMEL